MEISQATTSTLHKTKNNTFSIFLISPFSAKEGG